MALTIDYNTLLQGGTLTLHEHSSGSRVIAQHISDVQRYGTVGINIRTVDADGKKVHGRTCWKNESRNYIETSKEIAQCQIDKLNAVYESCPHCGKSNRVRYMRKENPFIVCTNCRQATYLK